MKKASLEGIIEISLVDKNASDLDNEKHFSWQVYIILKMKAA